MSRVCSRYQCRRTRSLKLLQHLTNSLVKKGNSIRKHASPLCVVYVFNRWLFLVCVHASRRCYFTSRETSFYFLKLLLVAQSLKAVLAAQTKIMITACARNCQKKNPLSVVRWWKSGANAIALKINNPWKKRYTRDLHGDLRSFWNVFFSASISSDGDLCGYPGGRGARTVAFFEKGRHSEFGHIQDRHGCGRYNYQKASAEHSDWVQRQKK